MTENSPQLRIIGEKIIQQVPTICQGQIMAPNQYLDDWIDWESLAVSWEHAKVESKGCRGPTVVSWTLEEVEARVHSSKVGKANPGVCWNATRD